MRDSDTYLAIIEEGEVLQAKRDILIVGQERLGSPRETPTRLETITDLARLDRIFRRCLKASAWQDLLDTP